MADTIFNADDEQIIIGTEDADTIERNIGNVKIQGLGGDDNLRNGGYYSNRIYWQDSQSFVTIEGGKGDDYLYNGGTSSVIDGGDDNDYVLNDYYPYERVQANYTSINGGAGDDSIINRGNFVTTEGGAGDDYIVNEAANFVYVYANGDGNDTIKGFTETSTLNITGAEYSSVKSGANTIVTVGDGSITLIDEEDETPDDTAEENSISIKINGEIFNVTLKDNDAARAFKEILPLELNMNELNGNEKYFYLGDDLPTDSINVGQIHKGDLMLYGSDCIVLFYKDFPTSYSYTRLGTLDNPEGLAEILGDGNVNVAFAESADSFDDTDADIDDAADDSVDDTDADADIDDAADDSVDDTDADADIDDTEDDSVDDTDADADIDDAADDSVDDSDADADIDDAADDNVDDTDADADIDDTADDSVDDTDADADIDDAADDSIDDTDADADIDDTADDSLATLIIDKFVKFSSMILNSSVRFLDASKHRKPINIMGNMFDNVLIGGTKNDTLGGGGGNNTLTGGAGKNTFLYSGGKGIITDYKKHDKIDTGELTYKDFAIDGKDLIFNFGNENSLTIQNGEFKPINLNLNVNIFTTDGIIDGKGKSIELFADIETFDAAKYSKLEKIDGSAAEDEISITGNKKKNYIIAGEMGASLSGGKGKDTLVGGSGADIFTYNKGDGKEVIEGFGEGDSINLDNNVTIKDAKIKGGDSVLKFKGGALTVKNTTAFTIGDMTYRGGVFIAGDSAKVYGSYKGEINLADYAVKDLDASAGKKKLTITGDDSANSLTGGKGKDILSGGAGNDSLWGGKGNDTLTGGAGDDTFIFQAGGGKDVITDYEAGDMLTILNKKGDEGTFSKATFKDDRLTLGVKGGGKVIFSGVDSETSININGDSKTVSELVK